MQPPPTLAHERLPGLRIALGGEPQELIDFARFARHRRIHVFALCIQAIADSIAETVPLADLIATGRQIIKKNGAFARSNDSTKFRAVNECDLSSHS
jgi:hypothetical protein